MKESTINNICIALFSRGAFVTTISQVAKTARVSRSTAHRFFGMCEQDDNIFFECYNGKYRRLYTKRYGDGTKVFRRGVVNYEESDLRPDDIVVRRGGVT